MVAPVDHDVALVVVRRGTAGHTGPVDKSDHRVRRMFAGIAKRYDFLNHLLSLNIDRRWRTFTTRVVAPCARGDDPRLLHRHGRSGAGV